MMDAEFRMPNTLRFGAARPLRTPNSALRTRRLRAGGGASAAHFRTGPAQRGADAVFGYTRVVADFVVRLALTINQPHDSRLLSLELAKQAVDALMIRQTVFRSVGLIFD